ncbi:MAG: alpha/beta hydrolase [Opitutaceae bacterium]|nr:alpha/beta hydrolase [Opitutaceae bacterium]
MKTATLLFAAIIVANSYLEPMVGAAEIPAPIPDLVHTPPGRGRFYVGGHYRTDAQGVTRIYGQMYVEYQMPAKSAHPYPIIMIHGAGSTGVVYTGTPDGRKGWADYFFEQGYATFVVDQPGRGRSGYNPEYGPVRQPSVSDRANKAKAETWPQSKLLTQFPIDPATAGPGDPVFDEMMQESVPGMADVRLQQQLTRDAGIALLDRIGPSILLTHSQSGPCGWLIGDARPQLVKAIIAIEPGASTAVGPAPMLKDEPQKWFLAELPLTFSPPVSDPSELHIAVESEPIGPGMCRCRRLSQPHHKLVNLEKIPVLELNGEASYHAIREHCTAQFLRDAGVPVDFVRLQDVGICGNGHSMMIEKNNLEIAAYIAGWIKTHTR